MYFPVANNIKSLFRVFCLLAVLCSYYDKAWGQVCILEVDSLEPFQRALSIENMRMAQRCNFSGVTVVPVVVHVIHNGNNNNVSDNDIIAQIEATNRHYRKENVSPTLYPGIAADTKIEFQLARSDPDGNPHSGITRTNWTSASPPYSRSYINSNIKPVTYWDTERYLNVWVADLEGGSLGFASFPTNTGLRGQGLMDALQLVFPVNEKTDGVVIDPVSVNHITYNTTLTHEIGHYLGLFHTFGLGLCDSDFCDDTPATNEHDDKVDCSKDYKTCGFTRDMIENFMDYSIPCHQIFTNDQKARMIVALNAPRRPDHISSYTNEWHGLDIYEPNGSPTSAANLFPQLGSSSINQTISSYIFHRTDYDWFKINVQGAGTLQISLNGMTKNYDLELYGPNGLSEWIDGSYNEGAVEDKITKTFSASEKGTYYFTVYGFQQTYDQCNPYNVNVQWTPETASSCTPVTFDINKTDLSAVGSNDGNASITVKSGKPPYTYLWSNGATTPEATNLSQGQYSVTVKGGDECKTTKSFYIGVQGTQEPFCGGTTVLKNSSGSFNDGSGNNYYANNSNCSWLISPSNNISKVNLSFTIFQLALGDTLFVYDGANSNSTILGKFYGNTLPPQISSTGKELYLVFKTDDKDTSQGWSAKYTTDIISTGPSISQYEYWFDDDHYNRTLFNISPKERFDFNSSIDVRNLSSGLHIIHLRCKDARNQWSSVSSTMFFKGMSSTHYLNEMSEYEYWFDDNSDEREQRSVSNRTNILLDNGIDISDLPTGVHTLNIRFKDSGNQWSSVLSTMFFKGLSENNEENNITEYEYWFDDETNQRKTISLDESNRLTLVKNLDVQELKNGVHSVNIRFKDSGNQWSSIISQLFFKIQIETAESHLISAYRYWFDNTPSNLQTVILPTPINPYYLISNINVSHLQAGTHSIHFQFSDSTGNWSSITTDNFIVPIGVVAAFTASDTILCNPGAVQFTNQNANASSYQWDFGDGTSSTSPNPKKTYTASGLFTVKLIAIGSDGVRDTLVKKDYIRIGKPTIELSPTQNICEGESTVLVASGAAIYNWSPSDGLDGVSGDRVRASPLTTTTYQVIGADNWGCKDTASVLVTVLPKTKLTTSASSMEICPGESITLTAYGANNIQWLPHNDWTSVNGATATAKPLATTTFYAIGSTQCGTDTSEITIIVKSKPKLITDEVVDVCLGSSVTLSVSGASSYFWSNGSTSTQINVQPTTSSVYSVIGTSDGCSDTASIEVVVHSLPKKNLSDVSICLGSSVTLDAGNTGAIYLWNDGSTSRTKTVSLPGLYTVSITNSSGCTIVDTAKVEVSDSLQINLADATICKGETVTLNAGYTGANYLWNTGATTQTITVNTAGIYSVLVTDSKTGCRGSGSTTVFVNELPKAHAGINQTICQGQFVNIGSDSNHEYIYSWSPSSGLSNINISNPVASPNISTNYVLTVTSNQGCIAKDTIAITVNKTPVSVLGDMTVCEGTPVILDAGNPGAGYLWSDGSTNPTQTITASGLYIVNISYGNCSIIDSAYVDFLSLPIADAGKDTSICAGSEIQLQAKGGSHYLWSTGQTSSNIYVSPNFSEKYIVTVTNNNGCSSQDSIWVSVHDLPIVTLSDYNNIVCDATSSIILTGGLPEGGVYSGNGVIDNSFYPSIAGVGQHQITYTYADENGCINHADNIMVVDLCTSLSEQQNQSDINVYPNPNTGIFHLKISGINDRVSIRIVNISGQVIYTDHVEIAKEYFNTFDMSRFSAGTYFINILYSDKSESIQIEKIN